LNSPFLPRSIYILLFSLLGVVYVTGLFVPLMDNDSAHHADIALRMYLTGDYVNLMDNGKDYLDKPHLHFWLSAWSYNLFGVTGFAYKLPSFLFSLFGVYSTFRLGKVLYSIETGRLAALLLATSFAFVLSNNDVRMDAILTSAVVFSIWQLVEIIQHKKLLNIAGTALGLAIGFSTKGHIAIFVPAIAALFYILYLKDWKILLNRKWILLVLLFAVLISPVVYCYYLQYNLHPEKVVRGHDHINGVKFILLNQSIDRFNGTMGSDAKHDYLFFFHSFLWAFAPWSLLAYMAIAGKLRGLGKRKEEWLTAGVFLSMLLVITFSGFKLPHYLNIIFPTTAICTAAYILENRKNSRWTKTIFYIQSTVVLLLILLSATINAWAFPVKGPLVGYYRTYNSAGGCFLLYQKRDV
jgi:4-amino-4-deoxy-L-arabinose transferase-like glycosyltransferase